MVRVATDITAGTLAASESVEATLPYNQAQGKLCQNALKLTVYMGRTQ